LGGERFVDDEEVEMEVWKWLRQRSKDFCAEGFDALVKRWNKFSNVGGGYVEKCFSHVRISHVLRFMSICNLFTDSLVVKHYARTTYGEWRYCSTFLDLGTGWR
jgi:hypothetical protein